MRFKNLAGTLCAIFLLLIPLVGELAHAISWSANTTRFTTSGNYDGFPYITQMSDGRIWIVWTKAIFGNFSLWVANSSDLGTTWSNPRNITMALTPGNDQNPTVIQAQNGTIWMAWTSDRPPVMPGPSPNFEMNATPPALSIQVGGSDDSTITLTSLNGFSDNVTLSALPLANVNSTLEPTEVFVPVNGTAASNLTVSVEASAIPGNYTLTVLGDPASYHFMHYVDIPLEIANLTMASGSADALEVSNNPQDLSPVVGEHQMQDYEIFFKTSLDNGATWGNEIQLTSNPADDLRPSIVQLANGTIWLVWQSNLLGNHDIYYMSTSNGTSWSSPKQLTTDLQDDKGPHIIQTEDGTIWVTWASDRTGDYEIYNKNYNGSAWSSATRLTFSNSTGDHTPFVLQTIYETMYMFWTSISPTTLSDLYYKTSVDGGASWSPSVQFTVDASEDMWPALVQTRDTRIWVVWTSNRAEQPDGNWDIYYRTSLAGDVNEDGAIDVIDLATVGMAYGSFEGQPNYNAAADINKDGIVDLRDVSIVSLFFGDT